MFAVLLAEGFEEMEAIVPADFLMRAGFEVVLAGVGSKKIKGTHGIEISCDITVDEIKPDDSIEGVILPGGMPGTLNLMKNDKVCYLTEYLFNSGKAVCAICAAPSILGKLGLLVGKKATCFPGFEDKLTGALVSTDFVCRDGNIITAKGAGAASAFALKIIEYLKGSETAEKIRLSAQCV